MTSSAPHSVSAASRVLDELAATRWSCRGFRSDPVDESIIESILRTASRTPSWCNTQPWHVHLTYPPVTARLALALRSSVEKRPEGEPDLPFPERYEGVYAERRR